jgi:hypothetical protein
MTAIEQKAEEVIDQVRDQLGELESILDDLDGRVQRLISERPLLALGGTLLAGFFAGRLLSRR